MKICAIIRFKMYIRETYESDCLALLHASKAFSCDSKNQPAMLGSPLIVGNQPISITHTSKKFWPFHKKEVLPNMYLNEATKSKNGPLSGLSHVSC